MVSNFGCTKKKKKKKNFIPRLLSIHHLFFRSFYRYDCPILNHLKVYFHVLQESRVHPSISMVDQSFFSVPKICDEPTLRDFSIRSDKTPDVVFRGDSIHE